MSLDKKDLLLYAVTDRAWLYGKTLDWQVEECLKGGATLVQLREKGLSFDEFLAEAVRIKEVCHRYGVKLIINDNVEVAKESKADGVHLGQGDMDPGLAREMLPSGSIIGVSVATPEQAIKAEKSGADYLGAGAVFSTSTKTDADVVPYDVLKEICESVSIPVCAIGGINGDNILKLSGSGISGVAVVSALFAAPDIKKATESLLELSRKYFSV